LNASGTDPRPLPAWEHFEHRADMGVAGFGATPADAFEQAALALTAIICDPAAVRPEQVVAIHCEEPDLELLFVDWLNALIYEMAVRHMLFSRFRVRFEGPRLQGEAWGEPLEVGRHEPAVEVKGATYTALAVRQAGDGTWSARCVVDV
jgi:SHS2 domain-containing protein